MFTVLLKSLLIFMLGSSIPGFGMKFTPALEFFFPAAKDILWDSVGKSKSHEVRSIALFPMWQVTPMFLNFCVWVQGMKLRGRIIQRNLRFGRRDARLPHRQDACATIEHACFVHNLLHVPQKPSVDLCKLVNLVNRRAFLKGLRDEENSFGIRSREFQPQRLNIDVFVCA